MIEDDYEDPDGSTVCEHGVLIHGKFGRCDECLRPFMKPRPTDAEFEELKRKRDEAVRATVIATCEKMGWDPSKTSFHASHMHGCYCACPDGPCQHKWDGPTVEEENMVDTTCSLCGASAFSHDLRCAE